MKATRSIAHHGGCVGNQMRCSLAPIKSATASLRPALPARPMSQPCGSRRMVVRSNSTDKQKSTKTSEEEPTPFFEPLVRSFILGVGAGALVETAHVTLQLSGLAVNLGYQQVVDALPSLVDELAPMFAIDHVAAVGSWMAFYIIEALAIISILDRYPNDKESANKAIRKMVTLPQRMLPLKLQFAKVLLLATNRLRGPAIAAAAPLSPRRPSTPSRSPSTKDLTTNAFVDGSSTTLLEPPSVVRDSPEIAALFPDEAPFGTSDTLTLPTPQAPRTNPKKPKKSNPNRKGLKPGAWDPNTMDFLKTRQRELTERKNYLKNFWYAAALSEKVGDTPVGVDILGMRIVLFRDGDGKVHCMQDACIHRGAPLSLGWVANVKGHDCVVCPYHGWAFDTEGKIRDVPSLEKDGAWPKRAVMDTFPVTEKGGFIWLFYGSKDMPEDERPPIPYCPELDDPNWQPTYGEIEFECGHWAVFENAIDMAHIHYLHNDSFGNSDQPKIHDMTVEREAFGIQSSFRIHNKPVNAAWEWTKTDSVPVIAKAMLPSSSCITIVLGSGVSMITFVNTVPISANRAVNRFCLIRNFAQWEQLDGFAVQAMYRILGEDKVMVEKLRPELVPREISLSPDLPQIAFRKLRQEYIDMGYGVDADAIDARGPNVSDM